MGRYIFGVGTLTATPTVGTPVTFGTLQEFALDISFNEKALFGSKSFPVDVARGQGKITGKIKAAEIDAAAFNDLFFGGTNVAAGGTNTVTMLNPDMGSAPTFSLSHTLTYKGKTYTITFPRCTSTKLAFPLKGEDHAIPELDVTVYADDSGNVFTWTSPTT